MNHRTDWAETWQQRLAVWLAGRVHYRKHVAMRLRVWILNVGDVPHYAGIPLFRSRYIVGEQAILNVAAQRKFGPYRDKLDKLGDDNAKIS